MKTLLLIVAFSVLLVITFQNGERFASENGELIFVTSEVHQYLEFFDVEQPEITVLLKAGYPDRLPHSLGDLLGYQEVWHHCWRASSPSEIVEGESIVLANGEVIIFGVSSVRGDLGTY